MTQKYDDLIINVEIDESARSSPALGQIDKMLRQSAIETQSLQVVRRMMMRDMFDRAQVTGVTKLSSAAELRKKHRAELAATNGHSHGNGHAAAPRSSERYKTKGYGDQARAKEALAKTNIVGPRLNLFILERLMEKDGEYISGHDIMGMLKATGKAGHLSRLSGVFGLLSSEGFVKHDERGYRITAPGRKFAVKLRTMLEEDHECLPGDYLAPTDYKIGSTSKRKRYGYKTMGDHMRQKAVHASA